MLIPTLVTWLGVPVQDPLMVRFPVERLAMASLNVRTTEVGALWTVPFAGNIVESVGAVLSTVIVALSDEAVERLVSASLAIPALARMVTVPLPLQALRVIVAPAVVILPTATEHDAVPPCVSVMPSPPAVSELVSVVPPLDEAVIVSAMVDVPELLSKVEDGVPSDVVGPTVLIV